MRPLRFVCASILPQSGAEIARGILDLDEWRSFTGWGPLPGIARAEFAHRADGVVGTRIAVTNTDGSTHTEEILAWDPEREVVLRLGGFSRPLGLMADHFVETWQFEAVEGGTRVVRTFEIHPRSAGSVAVLTVVRALLKRAVAKQMREMKRR